MEVSRQADTRRSIVRRAKAAGVSLTLELLMGLAFLSLAILSLFLLFPSAERMVRLADTRSQALHLARLTMEETLAQSYSALLVGEVDSVIPLSQTQRRGARPTVEYRTRLTISQDPDEEIKEIQVLVWWDSEEPKGYNQVLLSSSKGKLW